MDPNPPPDPSRLAEKIARLVEERGWNQEEFARIARLNRQTIRQILQPNGKRKLRNATVSACARALGVTVNELRHAPLERLLPRMHSQKPAGANPQLQRLYDQATQPELSAWLERNPDRASQLSGEEIDELLSVQGTGGPLTSLGVEKHVKLIERKRRLKQQLEVVANTEYIELLEQLVGLLYEKVQPYGDRK
jgi:transcriptional regulator with XRE-family HTH domain